MTSPRSKVRRHAFRVFVGLDNSSCCSRTRSAVECVAERNVAIDRSMRAGSTSRVMRALTFSRSRVAGRPQRDFRWLFRPAAFPRDALHTGELLNRCCFRSVLATACMRRVPLRLGVSEVRGCGDRCRSRTMAEMLTDHQCCAKSCGSAQTARRLDRSVSASTAKRGMSKRSTVWPLTYPP